VNSARGVFVETTTLKLLFVVVYQTMIESKAQLRTSGVKPFNIDITWLSFLNLPRAHRGCCHKMGLCEGFLFANSARFKSLSYLARHHESFLLIRMEKAGLEVSDYDRFSSGFHIICRLRPERNIAPAIVKVQTTITTTRIMSHVKS
jgi:hypothetical protein